MNAMKMAICSSLFTLSIGVAFGETLVVRDLANVTYVGSFSQDNIGWQQDGAGDINGDGLKDIVFGTDMTSLSETRPEFVNFAYLIPGASDLPEVIQTNQLPAGSVTVEDFSPNVPVAGLGDFNGDGYDDVILGDGHSSPGGLNQVGRAFILYGGNILPATFSIENPQVPGVMIEGGGRSAWLGFVVSRAGDVNGDGYADALLSAPAEYSTQTIMEAFLVYGGTNVPNLLNSYDLGDNGVRFRSAYTRSALGDDLSFAGDVNGDGYDDILLGTEVAFEGAAPEQAYIVFGSTDLPSVIAMSDLNKLGIEINGPAGRSLYGTRVSGGGDINGDGYDDFLVGAPNASPGGVFRAGQVYVIFGGPDLPNQIRAEDIAQYGVLINGFEQEARLGEALGGPGDINGDEYDDIILASPQKTEDVAIIFGRADFHTLGTVSIRDLERTVIWNPGSPGSFGGAITFTGDVNGDGRGDLMIGDRFNNGTKGEAFLIYGGKFDSTSTTTPTQEPSQTETPTPTPSRTPTPTLTPQKTQGFSGWILSGEGEVKKTPHAKAPRRRESRY